MGPTMSERGGNARWLALAIRLLLAGVLVGSHFVTDSPYVYPHYVLIILLHPPFLRRVFGVRLRPWQTVYVSIPVFLHPMGGLFRWYSTVWWFDHLTHFASATLVAAIGFTLASAYASGTRIHPWFVPAFTVAFVMTAGWIWEVVETLTPLLTVYGPNDTLWDYVFDFLGGVAVVALAPRLLPGPAEQLAERVEEVDLDLPVPAAIETERTR